MEDNSGILRNIEQPNDGSRRQQGRETGNKIIDILRHLYACGHPPEVRDQPDEPLSKEELQSKKEKVLQEIEDLKQNLEEITSMKNEKGIEDIGNKNKKIAEGIKQDLNAIAIGHSENSEILEWQKSYKDLFNLGKDFYKAKDLINGNECFKNIKLLSNRK